MLLISMTPPQWKIHFHHLLYWKEMSEHTWNDDVAVLKWAVKFDVLTMINAPAEMMMIHLDGAHQILFSLPPSLMFWIGAGRGNRVTIEKSWMDGSERSSLTVLTAQAAHSLTADVAARRLYWISGFKKVSSGKQNVQERCIKHTELLNALWCFRYTGSWWIIIIPLT